MAPKSPQLGEAIHGHDKVTVDQVHRADMEPILRCAELCKEDLSVLADNEPVVGNRFEKVALTDW
eukprot:7435285-Karenia_brevis.AAC.1